MAEYNPETGTFAPRGVRTTRTTMSTRNALGMWGGMIMALLSIGSSAYGIGTICHAPEPLDYAWVAVGLVMGLFNLSYAIGIAIKAEVITHR